MEQPREPIFYPNKIPCSIGVDNKTENTLQSKEFEALENMQNENGKVEVIIIKTESGKLFVPPFLCTRIGRVCEYSIRQKK